MPLHASLESFMTAAGMGPSSIVARYLDVIGLRTAQTLAVFFTSAQHIKDWMKRFQTGVATGTHNFKIDEETTLNVQTACLISIWQNCPPPPAATTPPAQRRPHLRPQMTSLRSHSLQEYGNNF